MKKTMQKQATAALLTGALLAAVAACGSSPAARAGVSGSAELVEAAPAAHPAVATAAQLRSAALSSSALGLQVYRQLLAEGAKSDNLAVSPSSLATALGMLLPGARGSSATGLSRVLGTAGLTPAQYATALGTLSRDEQVQARTDKNTLQQADDLWAQQGFGIRTAYLQTLAAAWNTGVHTTDFADNAAGSRQAINNLVQQETDGQIKNLFGPGAIDSSTRVVLTDAVYLHAPWALPFEKSRTTTQPFHLADGGTVEVPTMHRDDVLSYASVPGWQAAQIPYQGGDLAMDLLLPDGTASGFAASAAALTPARLQSLLGGLSRSNVDLALPRFDFETGETLDSALSALGLGDLFGPGADLSGIPSDGTPLSVHAVVQQTKVAVDENGTTAAAATGVAISSSLGVASNGRPHVLDLDRPFLFVIRDTGTGQILFLGQVTHP